MFLYCRVHQRGGRWSDIQLCPDCKMVTDAVRAERRRIILLARQFGTESTTALADLLEEDD